jgi:opacity protein-like surface antigen
MNGRWIVLVACTAAGLATAARAQDLKTVEFTPFYGYSFSGGLEDEDTGRDYDVDDAATYGGMVDIRVGDMTQVELFFSRQETEVDADDGLFADETLFDLDIDYYHIGGTYIILDGPWQPFVVATVGATHLAPDASDSDSITRFSAGIGGGVRFFPTENFGLYLGARGLFTFFGDDTSIESESGSLTVELGSDGLWQVLLQAGVIFAF